MTTIAGIRIPDSTMARAATELVRDTEPDLLYNHSRRVFLFGALAGERKQFRYDPELLYIGAMFHDMGLIDAYSSKTNRFEMDVLGLAYHEFGEEQRVQVVAAHPREKDFKNGIIDAFAHGTIRKPDTTFGNVKADVLELRDPGYKRLNFCQIILGSAWDDSDAGHTPRAGCGCADSAGA